MPAAVVHPVSRVAYPRSRLLIHDSRALIASAKELLDHARQALARQRSVRIVCAWCQAPMRFERSTVTARGHVSHSICYDCFVSVFQELDSHPPLPVRLPHVP
jgi:hypothetical protein